MGAQDFFVRQKGKTAEAAFSDAVDQAKHEHGHGGYTGTIAEKFSFVMIGMPPGEDPIVYADKLLNGDDNRVCDKWGPAGCIKIADGEWLFFGMASS
jgi:hypothetical protein